MASLIPDNPFVDPLLEHFRDVRPDAQDPYRSFFVARITSRTLIDGVHNYGWVEQTFDTTTGLPTDANPQRSGSIGSGLPISPAIEVNNVQVGVGTLVFLKQKGIVNGQVYYEFADATNGTGGSAPDPAPCAGCGWVAGLRSTHCLVATVLSRAGACDCEEVVEDCAECPDGAPLVWTADTSAFVNCDPAMPASMTWTHTAGCVWESGTSTLTFAGGDASAQFADGIYVGGPLYVGAIGDDCCGPIVLTRDQADACDSSPATITLTRVGACTSPVPPPSPPSPPPPPPPGTGSQVCCPDSPAVTQGIAGSSAGGYTGDCGAFFTAFGPVTFTDLGASGCIISKAFNGGATFQLVCDGAGDWLASFSYGTLTSLSVTCTEAGLNFLATFALDAGGSDPCTGNVFVGGLLWP
jgi:hypothetical protein